ncbi:helix-turn-helix domain-containing protein [Arthrobacter sp. yr096]|uniref:helix-turn-helix domain-containing protein n=1 Tax=Arthrobacter sp. yr096 TaxID=1761750 RepID=UPI00115FC853|nr:helix-turn-helix domain-containing protein [Arthrobacter sp. yr096]
MPASKRPESGPLARAFAAELRAALARQRITAKDLARLVDLTPAYVNKRLRDEAPFTLNDVEVIIRALGGAWDHVAYTAIDELRVVPAAEEDEDDA